MRDGRQSLGDKFQRTPIFWLHIAEARKTRKTQMEITEICVLRASALINQKPAYTDKKGDLATMTTKQLKEGASVVVKALKKIGVVEADLGGGKFRIAVGSLKITCGENELEPSSTPPSPSPSESAAPRPSRPKPPSSLDLHGMRVDDAIRKLDQWLDDVILSEISFVKVVHGFGTGKVQEAVHKHLATLKAVRHFRINDRNPGETDVYL